MYLAGCTIPRVYHRVYLAGCILPYIPQGVPSRVYTSLYALLHPGYTLYIPCCLVYRSSCPVCVPLPEDGALGSNLGIVREYEAHRGLLSSKVCRMVGDCAQSYSLSPWIN